MNAQYIEQDTFPRRWKDRQTLNNFDNLVKGRVAMIGDEAFDVTRSLIGYRCYLLD